jgi:hypothetical protein
VFVWGVILVCVNVKHARQLRLDVSKASFVLLPPPLRCGAAYLPLVLKQPNVYVAITTVISAYATSKEIDGDARSGLNPTSEDFD